MSVAADVFIRRRPWLGYEDPGLPISAWYAEGAVTGNASGGERQISLILEPVVGRKSGLMYSLEELTAADDDAPVGGIRTAILRTINMDRFGAGTLNPVERHLGIEMRGFLGPSTPAIAGLVRDTKPRIFLGTANPVFANAQLTLETANVDGQPFKVTASGFIWGARALLAPNGLRRPADGIF